MRFENQLKTFLRILNEYPGDVPLAKFLPVFFRANKQMGSTDRRTASRLLYNYFRIGKAVPEVSVEERLMIAEFLCERQANPFLENFRPDFNQRIELLVEEKIEWLNQQGVSFNLYDVFPFHKHLSAGLDKTSFLNSFFIQPDLFIRLHPGKEKQVKNILEVAGIPFIEEGADTLRLQNGTKLDQLFPDLRPFEIQDLSSQKTVQYFKPQKYDYWWDACAASGGKSLLLFSQQPEIKLLVSDVRESVLSNLDERFQQSGLRNYQKKVLDLTEDPQPFLHSYLFDGIILDAPCSGSGTWGRTPEMIGQFREQRILSFQRLQQSIAKQVVKYLKEGNPLIFITCSVFKEENEENVDFLVKELGLKLEKQELIKGYNLKADSMFVARLIK
ncbi:RsmB/NOP family class I SAM-dependent RNA methyltransferase [Rubrolithibacter danxiaensis]|uniref:RsmB/NOP family class I SAM-dependent RNA methyltransferase n=1 Tax=Rubrolithibacter danxiaensis TaxID=3390805 RepID=UPI003BF7B701